MFFFVKCQRVGSGTRPDPIKFDLRVGQVKYILYRIAFNPIRKKYNGSGRVIDLTRPVRNSIQGIQTFRRQSFCRMDIFPKTISPNGHFAENLDYLN
jgi:hypothetical protein